MSCLTIALFALAFTAFFSGTEIAFLSVDRLSLEVISNTWSSRFLKPLTENYDRFITTTLIGSTISLVVYTFYMAEFLDPILHKLTDNQAFILLTETILSTLLILVFAEFLPKSLFLRNPKRVLQFFAIPMALVSAVLYPLVSLSTCISKLVIARLMKTTYQLPKRNFELTDLHNFLKKTLNEKQQAPFKTSAKIVHNLLNFRQSKIKNCLTPRTDLIAINVDDDIEVLRKIFIESEHSKILVYQNDIDEIIGYCHARQLFDNPKNIRELIITPIIVSEMHSTSDVLVQMMREQKSLALVVDEFGGTAGISSMEDIIEEIVGEINDENDDVLTERMLSPNIYLLSARHEIDYLNEKYGWKLPLGDYDTLSGLLLSVIERIPEQNEEIRIGEFIFTVTALEQTHISEVKLIVSEN